MDKYDDGGRGKSVPVGPDMLPDPDPRLTGRQPVTEPAPDRHPAGADGGQGGRFR